MLYLKAIVSAAVAAVGAIVVALGAGTDQTIGNLDTTHWLVAALVVLSSGGLVALTENGPWHTYIKTVMAFLTAGLASLVVALNDNHISQAEYLIAFSAAVAASGFVFQVKNTPSAA